MLTYSTIAARILSKLYKEGSVRSKELIKTIGFTESVVYKTLDEMLQENLIYKSDNRPKFVIYDLTDKGRKMVNEEEVKGRKMVNEEEVKHKEENLKQLAQLILKDKTPTELLSKVFTEIIIIQHQEMFQKVGTPVVTVVRDNIFKNMRKIETEALNAITVERTN